MSSNTVTNDDEVTARRKGFTIRDAIIFLLDWRLPMTQCKAVAPPSSVAFGASTTSSPSFVKQEQQEEIQPQNVSLLSATLRVVAEVMRTKVLAKNSDAVAVVAFGSGGEPTQARWPSIRVIRPLKPSDATGIKLLQRLAAHLDKSPTTPSSPSPFVDQLPEPDADLQPFLQFGPDSPVQFDKALWAVRHQFTTISAAPRNILHRKRVLIFTNDDDPTRGSVPIRQLALTQARDLADLGATLDVTLLSDAPLPLETQTVNFTSTQMDGDRNLPDTSKFFSGLVYPDDTAAAMAASASAGDGDSSGDNTSGDRGVVSVAYADAFDVLCERITRSETPKRAIRHTTLSLDAAYSIGVALYALTRRAARPQKVELVAATNKPVFKVTTTTCENVGQILKTDEVRYMAMTDFVKQEAKRNEDAQKARTLLVDPDGIGDIENNGDDTSGVSTPSPIHGFSKAELARAKAIGKEGLYLYGFRNASTLKLEHSLGPPTFIFPYDGKLSGSTKAFTALHASMLKRKVIAIVSVRASSVSGVRFAALVPQQERHADDDGDVAQKWKPSGMCMYYLPFKDDVYTAWRKELPHRDESLPEGGSVVKKEEDLEVTVVKSESEQVDDNDTESEAVSVARRLIRKLKMRDYSVSSFANPDLQRFYTSLQKAAGISVPPTADDDRLTPATEAMQQRAGHLLREWKRQDAGKEFDGAGAAGRFGTRGAMQRAKGEAKRRIKELEKEQERVSAEMMCDDGDFVQRQVEGTLNELRVKELQVYCKAKGLPWRGNKRNLVLAVDEHVAKRLRTEAGLQAFAGKEK